jgi:hypothetical protein
MSQAVKLLLRGVQYCPHPKDVSEDAYHNLTRDLPPAARESNACPGREFAFREFNDNASHLLRSEHSGMGWKISRRALQQWCILGLPYYDEGTKKFHIQRD